MDTTYWDFSVSPLATVAGVLLLALLGFLCFINITRGGKRPGVVLAESVKFLAGALLVLTLFRPERVQLSGISQTPAVAVLLDQSGSMETVDLIADAGERPIARSAWLQQQVEQAVWSKLEESYDVRVTPFAGGEERGTDINQALEASLSSHDNLRAVLLLSDGDWNVGESPVAAATKLRGNDVPVFAVSAGSDRYLPDLELLHVNAPAYGLLNEQISIPFTIQSRLPVELKTTIHLNGPGGTEASKEVTIPAMGQLQDSVVLTPKFNGTYKYTLQLPVLQRESIRENNRKSFQIAFRRELLKVLIIESVPRWEFRYLHNALSRDPGVEVNCLLLHPQLGTGEGKNYLSAFPESRDKLSEYDVVFLGDVGIQPGQLTEEQALMLKGLVEQQGSGLVFLPGLRGHQQSIYESELGQLNPVVMDEDQALGTGSRLASQLVLTSRGREHLLTMLASDPASNFNIWRELPGFYWHAGVAKPRVGSTVLAVHETARSRFGRTPLLATRNCGNGKSLFLGTDGAWRWRRGVEDTYHYRFWGQVVRWMSHQRHIAHNEGIRFFFSPESPQKGDTVYLSATVFDRDGFPLEGADVKAEVQAASESLELLDLQKEEGGWGVYSGSFQAREGGDYSITISSKENNRSVSTRLMVAEPVLEKVGRPARFQSLREIAAITRGEARSARELDAVVDQIQLLPKRKPLENRFALWSHPLWCGLIMGLLVLYWTLRKYLGLI